MISINNEVITVLCKMCHKEYAIIVDHDNFNEWIKGHGYIQELLKDLTAGERELLISQTCDDCWKLIWGEI